MWRPSLAELLKKWIKGTHIQHNVYVMLWGHVVRKGENVTYPNYAKALWANVGNVSETFLLREAHHSTFPGRDNNFAITLMCLGFFGR